MSIDPTLASLSTLDSRLSRLEYYLSGSTDPAPVLQPILTQSKDHTLSARLSRLERDIAALASRSKPVRDLLQLQAAHPTLFHPTPSSPSALPSSSKLATVSASASSYQQTASQLQILKDLPIPPSTAFMNLMALKPRIVEAEAVQQQQVQDVRVLRDRSARALQLWYEMGVLAMGECWAEWEGRVMGVERTVRRREREARVEQGEAEEVG